MTKQFDDLVTGVAKKLADDGKLIEAGWVGLKLAAIPADAPQVQVDEMRLAFMAQAHNNTDLAQAIEAQRIASMFSPEKAA